MNKQHRILVVDDEASMREFLDVLLSKEGYRVSLAKNGKQAVKLIKNNSHDLILSDIRLGDITGLDVLKEAKKQDPDTVVIMISAYSTTEIAVDAMNQGAYDFVQKPLTILSLKPPLQKPWNLEPLTMTKKGDPWSLRIISILIG